MPKLLPALLSGALAGLLIGPIACVFVARIVPDDRPVAGLDGAPERAEPDEDGATDPGFPASLVAGWLAEVVDLARCFGPPARAEYFLLARRTADGDPAPSDEDDDALAVVALRRLERPGARLLEREVIFREGGVRLHHTESIEGEARRLVWREFLPSGARSWMAEWRPGSERVRTIAYGWKRPVHEWLDGAAGLVGPLELLDRVRRGGAPEVGDVAMVDPTAAAVARVDLRTVDSMERTERTAEARRGDGSLVIEAVMALDEARTDVSPALASLRFHDGATLATPIDENEFRRRCARWRIETRPAHEAVLALVPDRR